MPRTIWLGRLLFWARMQQGKKVALACLFCALAAIASELLLEALHNSVINDNYFCR